MPLPKVPLLVEVIGEPGVGKTHFSLLFPSPFLIDTTAKGEALPIVMKLYPDDWQKRYRNISDWEELEQAVGEALADESIKTVIIDTSADLQRLAVAEYLRRTKKQAVYPITQYQHVRKLIDDLQWKIIKALRNLVLVAQMKDEYVQNQKTGRRIRDGYKKTPFQADLRFYIYLEREDDGSVRRHVKVVKNRFVDPTGPDWVDEINPSWEDVKAITKLPEEVFVE